MKRWAWIIVNTFACGGMLFVGHLWPEQIERIYSRGIYVAITNQLALISRWFPFSLSELYFLIIGSITIIFLVLGIGYGLRRQRKKSLSFFLNVVVIVSVNVTMFLMLWGLNNYRLNIETLFEFNAQSITQVDLENTYQWLITQANQTKEDMGEEDILDRKTIMNITDEGYTALSQSYSFIVERQARVKPLSVSKFFSQSGYSGVYLYVFSEPTINIMPHITSLPFVASHEMAHQQGFASEDDANFIGFLAASQHEEKLFRYSAYLSGMSYVGNSLYKTDAKAYRDLYSSISPAVLKDLKARSDFWEQHRKPQAERVHNQVNDLFLKANNQPDGVLNYSNVSKLIVLGYKKQLY
ncbi:DUF3810 domain-containing protein [Vallitaleaceae bacterium 9-2]